MPGCVAGWTGCRWRWSWLPRGPVRCRWRRSWPRWTTGSGCCLGRGGSGRRISGRWPTRSRGVWTPSRIPLGSCCTGRRCSGRRSRWTRWRVCARAIRSARPTYRCCWPSWWTSRCCSRSPSSSSCTAPATSCWRRSGSTRTPVCRRRATTWSSSGTGRSRGVRRTSTDSAAPGPRRTVTAAIGPPTRTPHCSRWRWNGRPSWSSGTWLRGSCSASGSRGSTRRVWPRVASAGRRCAPRTSRTRKSTPRSVLRGRVLARRAHHRHLLSSDLPCAHAQARERRVLRRSRRCLARGLSSVPQVPAAGPRPQAAAAGGEASRRGGDASPGVDTATQSLPRWASTRRPRGDSSSAIAA